MEKDKLFGIDYNVYICGGIGGRKRAFFESRTIYFYKESTMLKELAELKDDNAVGEIRPFTASVTKEEYKL